MNIFTYHRWSKMITISRTAAGSYSGGEFAPGAEELIDIKANVQPMQMDDTLQEFGGRRTKDMVVIYSSEELHTSDPKTGTAADVVTLDGEKYDILNVERWDKVIKHYRAVAARRED